MIQETQGKKLFLSYVTFKAFMSNKVGQIDLKTDIRKTINEINFDHYRNDKKLFSMVENHIGLNRWHHYVLYLAYWHKGHGRFHISAPTEDNFNAFDKLNEQMLFKEVQFRIDMENIIKLCRLDGHKPSKYFFVDNRLPPVLKDQSISLVTKFLTDVVFNWSGKIDWSNLEVDVIEKKKLSHYKKIVDKVPEFLYIFWKFSEQDKKHYKQLTKKILSEV